MPGYLFSDIGAGIGTALGGPIGGAAVMGGLNLLGGAMQQGASAEQVQQQEAFQERMSDTQYQRGAADLKAAGINPLLYFGADSAMPGASYAPQNIVGNAVGSAVQVGSALSSMGLQQAQAGQADATAVYQSALTDLTDHQRDVLISQILNLDANTKGVQLNNSQKQILTKFYQDHPDVLKTQAVLQGLFSPLATGGSAVAGAIAQF